MKSLFKGFAVLLVAFSIARTPYMCGATKAEKDAEKLDKDNGKANDEESDHPKGKNKSYKTFGYSVYSCIKPFPIALKLQSMQRTLVLLSFFFFLGWGDYVKHHKRANKMLSKLPSEVKAQIESGGADSFKNVSVSDLEKLPSSVYAHIGKDALQNLDKDQLKAVVRGFNKGSSKKDLENILENVNPEQLEDIMLGVKNNSKMFSKSQKEAFVKEMVRRQGDPSTWSKSEVAHMGGMVSGLGPNAIKSLAKAGKEVFEESLKQMKNAGVEDMSRGQKKAVMEAAFEKYGSGKSWNAEILNNMAGFIPQMKKEEIKELPPEAVSSSVENLGKVKWNAKQAREMMKKLKDKSKGFGDPDVWTGENLKSLGNLSEGFTPKDIKQLSKQAVREALKELGKNEFNKAQARVFAKQVVKSLGNPKDWSRNNVSNAANILLGFKAKQLEELPASALADSLKDINKVRFSKDQARAVVKNVKNSLGDPSKWNASVIEDLGPLLKGLSMFDLQSLPGASLQSALKSLKDDDTIPPAKKRAFLKKARSAGEVRIVEVGSFLKTFSLNDLQDVDIEKDLGLSDEYESNSTDEEERAKLQWKVSQARAVLKKVEAKWGNPNDSDSGWTLENIRRLNSLVKGSWKTLIKALSKDDYRDIVEFFSEFKDWMPGQAKGVMMNYKEKLGYDTPEEFSRMDEVDVSSLGHFVSKLDKEELEQLSSNASAEAVRQIGKVEFKELPRELRKKKAQDVLQMLGKARGSQSKVQISQLSEDELQDMGNAVLGLDPIEIEELKPVVFKGVVASLGDIHGFEDDQLVALAKIAKEAFKGDGSAESAASQLSEDNIRDLANILRGFSKADFHNFGKQIVQDSLDVFGAIPLSREQAEEIVEKSESARKRREIDYSSKTGDDLIALGSSLVGLTTENIASISDAAFEEAVATIGKVSNFTQEQLQAWATLAKKVWNSDVGNITADQLLRLGVIAVGFPAEDLAKMDLSSDEVIESLGEQPVASRSSVGYSADQLEKAFTRVKELKKKEASTFTGDEIAALKNFALALTPSEISQLNNTAYQSASATLGNVMGWSEAQLEKLKVKAVAVYGEVTKWTPEQLREAGAALGGFSKAEIQSLTADHIEMIATSALVQIPPKTFEAFSNAQLEMFSSSQAAAVTSEQRSALSIEKANILLAKEGKDKVKSGAYRACVSPVITLALSYLWVVYTAIRSF